MAGVGFGAFAQNFSAGLRTGIEMGERLDEAKKKKAVEEAIKEAANTKRPIGESRDISQAALDYGITPDELAKAKSPDDMAKLFQNRQKLSNPALNIESAAPLKVTESDVNLGGIPTRFDAKSGRAIPAPTMPAPAQPVAQPTKPAALPAEDMTPRTYTDAMGVARTTQKAPIQDTGPAPVTQKTKAPYVYKDVLGQTRVAEEYDELSRSEQLRMASRKLMEMGLSDKADELREKAYKSLKMDIEEGKVQLDEGLNKANRQLQLGDQQGAFDTMLQATNLARDGITYKVVPVEGGVAMVASHTETGLPVPMPGLPTFTDKDPMNAGRTPAQQMYDFLSGLASRDEYGRIIERNVMMADKILDRVVKDRQIQKADVELKYMPREKEMGLARDAAAIRASDASAAASYARAARGGDDSDSETGGKTSWQDGYEDVLDKDGFVKAKRRFYFNPKTRVTLYDSPTWGMPVAKQWMDDANSAQHMRNQARKRGLKLTIDPQGRPAYTDGKGNNWYTAGSYDAEQRKK